MSVLVIVMVVMSMLVIVIVIVIVVMVVAVLAVTGVVMVIIAQRSARRLSQPHCEASAHNIAITNAFEVDEKFFLEI